jgi:hypothetical protein
MLPCSMLSSTSTSAPRSPVVPSPPLCKSPHQYHSMGLTLPLFSYSCALFCTAKNPNPFRFILFRTLCTKHRGWGIPCFSAASVHSALKSTCGAMADPPDTRQHPFVYPARPAFPAYPACPEERREERREPRRERRSAPTPFRIRTYAKRARNPFRIRTYAKHIRNPFRRNTSKTQHLKSFRIRTYEKRPGGRGLPSSRSKCALACCRGKDIAHQNLQRATDSVDK